MIIERLFQFILSGSLFPIVVSTRQRVDNFLKSPIGHLLIKKILKQYKE